MEDLTPVTEKEFAKSIAVAFAALRARGDIGKRIHDGVAADKLANSLWEGGLRPFQRPPANTGLGTGAFYQSKRYADD